MRRRTQITSFALALAAAALTLSAADPAPADAAGCEGANQPSQRLSHHQARKAMRCLVNDYRARHGLGGLRANGDLAAAATKHSRVMKRKDCFSHRCPGEAPLLTRITRSGYLRGVNSFDFGEVLGRDTRRSATPRSIFSQWKGSALHRAVVLKGSFEHLGIGLVNSRGLTLYTIDFGHRSG